MKAWKLPVKRGDEGHHVQVLQIILMLFGAPVPAKVRGMFRVNTELGVKHLQREWRLAETGIVDEQFVTELELRGVNFSLAVRSTKPHAPYYLSKRPTEEGPGIPVREGWILSPGRRFKLYDGRIFRIHNTLDGGVRAECENTELTQRSVITFNKVAFLRLIEEELAPAETV